MKPKQELEIEDATTEKALALGFFPVEIDFSDEDWEAVGTLPLPMWLRHDPDIGHEVLFFNSDEESFRGKVAKKAYYMSSASDFSMGDSIFKSNAVLFLWLENVTPCPTPHMDNIWRQEEK